MASVKRSVGMALQWIGLIGREKQMAAKENGTKVQPLKTLSSEQLRTFLKGVPEDWRSNTDRSRGVPPPPAQKPVPEGARCLSLVPPSEFLDRPRTVSEAVSSRRSRRVFTDEALTLEALSFLLWHTQGVTGSLEDSDGSKQDLRATPSGGARYPLEICISIQRIKDVSPGLYRLDPAGWQLVETREDARMGSRLQRICFDDPMVGDAAAVVIFTAIPYRTEWSYGYISHRLIAFEAGHAAQNLYLAAEAVGAGACAMAAYHQPSLDELLGVDGNEEFALYMMAIGSVADAEPCTGQDVR